MRKSIVILAILLLSPIANAANFTGVVVKVLDGDTADVLHDNKPERIRFNGIDAPETGMPHGQKAKQFVLDMAAQKVVTVEVFGTDKYGRTIGDIILPDGKNLNREIVKAGYAWWYRKYSTDASLGDLEAEARNAKKGLWQDKEPMPPWEWRAAQRNEVAATQGAISTSQVSNYHGNVNSSVFHKPSCEHFNCKNCSEGFSSREDAISSGYKPCDRCRP
jgi:endonuclease YncB( thermonuclease family)